MSDDHAITPGDTIRCDERRAENPRHDFGPDYQGLGPRFVSFRAVVDHVEGDYLEATVVMRNPHMKSPDPGAQLALSAETIAEDPRWRAT